MGGSAAAFLPKEPDDKGLAIRLRELKTEFRRALEPARK